MAALFDPDRYCSGSLENVLGSLKGPLEGGALRSPLKLDPTGHLIIDRSVRRPTILAVLKRSLEEEAIELGAILDPDGQPKLLSSLRYQPYSELGSTLILHVPPMTGAIDVQLKIKLAITASIERQGGAIKAIDPAEFDNHFRFELIEGNAGKLIYLLVQEKARIRRQARELLAMKSLRTAQRDALDRIGADLGVLRFQDDLAYDAARDEIITVIRRDVAGKPELESDADYRRRIELYHPFLLSTPDRFGEVLNGKEPLSGPNTGPISGLGLQHRFLVEEENNPFALAIRILGVGSDAPRDNFLNYLLSEVLIWLPNSNDANAAHASRYVPLRLRTKVEDLRKRLRSAYSYPAKAAVAPRLADALDRLGRLRGALGVSGKLKIVRAQDSGAGSRYELGLGVDVELIAASDLDDMVQRLNDPTRTLTDDSLGESLVLAARALPPSPASDDPIGSWLFRTCGFRTVHRIDAGTIYLSHLPTLGLKVDGPNSTPAPAAGQPATAEFEAHFYPSDDPAINATLFSGLVGSAADWSAAGHSPWAQLAGTDQADAWGRVAEPAENAPVLQTFAAAGLPLAKDPAGAIAQFSNVPKDMVATISLDPTFAADIIAANNNADERLRELVTTLKKHFIASAAPFVTSMNEVLVVVSVLGLPQVGVNLGERRTSGFRWYTVSLGGKATAKAIGSRTTLNATATGVVALVCLGYARQGLADPYEVRVELPDDAKLTLAQYEFLMNALQQLYPIGVEINTYSIRQSHVDLAGNGIVSPLKPSVFRTYRAYRRKRLRGIYQQES